MARSPESRYLLLDANAFPADQLLKWGERLLSSSSLDEVFGRD